MKMFGKALPKLRNTLILLLAFLLVMFLTLRSLSGATFFRTHDFTHAARLVEMQRSLAAHEFPVRWSRNFGFGYGMPLFNFYAPLPYYIGQIPLFFGASPVDATKFLYVLNGALAFIGMYLLGKEFWSRKGGLIAAIVFSFSTYRAVDLFVRGALGESYAFVLIPFALYGLMVMQKHLKIGWLITTLSLAAILLSHNLTGMVSVVLLVCFWLGLQILSKSKLVGLRSRALFFALSLVMGISLSAFYVLPAYFEKSFTRVDQTIVVGSFDYHNHFLCATQLLSGKWGYGGSAPGCQDGLSFALGTGALLLFGLSIVLTFTKGRNSSKLKMVLVTMGFAGSGFLTIGRSTWVWDHISLLKYFQFPWRFLTFTHIFLALGVGAIGILFQFKLVKSIVAILLALIVITQFQHFLPEKIQSLSQLDQYYNTSPAWIQSEISSTLPDYLPPGATDANLPKPAAARLSSQTAVITPKIDQPAKISASVSCQIDCAVLINIFQFPGWSAYLDGNRVQLDRNTNGLPLYTVNVPAGDHELVIVLEDTIIRSFGNFLSLISVISLIVISLYVRKKQRLHV